MRLSLSISTGALLMLALAFTGCSNNSGSPGAPPKTPPPGTPPSPVSQEAQGPFGKATVTGRIRFEGAPPKLEPIIPTKDSCDTMHNGQPIPDEAFLLNPNKTLKNVFVYLEGVQGQYTPPGAPFALDQQGCLYKPRVFGVMAGQKISVRNSDPTFHNVRTVTKANQTVNIGQGQNKIDEFSFDKPEVMLEFHCDIHKWMHSFVGVMPHPFFAVTGDDGQFNLQKLPAGKYKLVAWHELLGEQSQDFTLGDGEQKEITLSFKR